MQAAKYKNKARTKQKTLPASVLRLHLLWLRYPSTPEMCVSPSLSSWSQELCCPLESRVSVFLLALCISQHVLTDCVHISIAELCTRDTFTMDC